MLRKRGFEHLAWSKNADGTHWEMPKASFEGLLKYKKLVSAERQAVEPDKAVIPQADRGALAKL